ncbi:MAG: universal stress protein [Polyangiaceae bacterium]|jgi:nucleotide-binding universal stress UspA family protein
MDVGHAESVPSSLRAGASPVKRILVALDGSARAARVLQAAVDQARAHGAQIVALRAIGLSPEVPQDFYKTTDRPLLDVLSSHARADLQERAAQIPADLLASDGVQVVVGVPWDAICHAARRLGVDLVVIGSHGYRGLDHVLGTTAAKVVNHAPCSVLVVRDASPVLPAR